MSGDIVGNACRDCPPKDCLCLPWSYKGFFIRRNHPFTLSPYPHHSYKGFFIRGKGRWPAIDRWFEAMEKRDTYMGLRSDFYTHCHDLPPQLGGEARVWADL